MTTFATAIDAAVDNCQPNQLADLSRQVWRAWSAGHIDDQQAQDAAISIAKRKSENVGMPGCLGGRNNAPAGFSEARVSLPKLPKRKIPVSPDKAESMKRRRRWAASGRLPPSIAEKFTQAEHAVMAVILNEVKRQGVCALVIDRIAALAGCSRSTVKRACRKSASFLGLLLIRERRRRGQKSLSNILTCISDQVRRWLRMPDRGSRKLPQSTDLKTGIRGGPSLNRYALDGAG